MATLTGISEEIYLSLKNELLNLELLPGQQISENEISTRFHASRTPVRDVFTRLATEGLLVIEPHVGTIVSKINLDRVRDVLYMRERLESAVLEEVALVIDPMQKFKMSVQLIEQGELLKQDLDEQQMAEAFHLIDNRYHRTLFQIVRREHVFDHIIDSFCDYERYRVFLNLTKKSDLQDLYYQHLELMDNLYEKKVSRMKVMIHEHLYGGLQKAIPMFQKHESYFIGNIEEIGKEMDS